MNEVPWPLQLNQESQTVLSRVCELFVFLAGWSGHRLSMLAYVGRRGGVQP